MNGPMIGPCVVTTLRPVASITSNPLIPLVPKSIWVLSWNGFGATPIVGVRGIPKPVHTSTIRSTVVVPGHSPGATPASAVSPIHRTPTNKTPPNNTSPNKLITANSPTTGQFPNPLLGMRPTPPPMQAMSAHSSPGISSQPQIPQSSQSASGLPAKNSAANSVSKPAQKPLLPWVLLAIFLLVAVGLLVFVLTKK